MDRQVDALYEAVVDGAQESEAAVERLGDLAADGNELAAAALREITRSLDAPLDARVLAKQTLAATGHVHSA